MRYFVRNKTLFIRGDFNAASTGIHGGSGHVTTIFNRTVPENWAETDPYRSLNLVASREGYGEDFFGMVTAVEMRNLCILQYDFLTTFITAGVKVGTINIIVCSEEGLSPAALLETIMVATEAKTEALLSLGYACTGTPTDAVIVASEGEEEHTYAGVLTEVGRRVRASVRYGVEQALLRHEGKVERAAPSFFVYSRYHGEHWAEWKSEGCPYYPCHFPGQACDFCYCPFYPCKDADLGDLIESSNGGKVWSCSRCELLHQPEVAEYLKRNPEATLTELKRVKDRLKKRDQAS